MKSKKDIIVDTHLKTTINNSKIQISLSGLPATATIDDNGEIIGQPEPCQQSKDYAIKNLVDPIVKVMSKYKKINGLNMPDIVIKFSNNLEKYNTNNNENHNKSNLESEETKTQFQIEQPNWNLDNVILPKKTKERLEVVLNLVKHHNLMYELWDLKSISPNNGSAITLNFYGPSGTGKTLCAEAVASYLQKNIIRVNYASLESKYVGEMNKNICKAFQIAQENDCVLFFDEADSILGKRLSIVTQAADHGINMARSVMLIELERFEGIVIFSTNFMKNYDQAFARRLLHSVKFELPDLKCRKNIFDVHLPNKLPLSRDIHSDDLAHLTEGFSGGDIRNVVLKAAAKAANQNISDSEKKISIKNLTDAIDEIRDSSNEIDINQKCMNKKWMQSKVDNMVSKSSTV